MYKYERIEREDFEPECTCLALLAIPIELK